MGLQLTSVHCESRGVCEKPLLATRSCSAVYGLRVGCIKNDSVGHSEEDGAFALTSRLDLFMHLYSEALEVCKATEKLNSGCRSQNEPNRCSVLVEDHLLGSKLKVFMRVNKPMYALFVVMAKRLGCPVNTLRILHGGRKIFPFNKPSDGGLVNGGTISVFIAQSGAGLQKSF